jgi:hypothetical protein
MMLDGIEEMRNACNILVKKCEEEEGHQLEDMYG